MRVLLALVLFIGTCWIYSMIIPTLGWGLTVLLFVGMQTLGGIYAYMTSRELANNLANELTNIHELTDEEWKRYGG